MRTRVGALTFQHQAACVVSVLHGLVGFAACERSSPGLMGTNSPRSRLIVRCAGTVMNVTNPTPLTQGSAAYVVGALLGVSAGGVQAVIFTYQRA